MEFRCRWSWLFTVILFLFATICPATPHSSPGIASSGRQAARDAQTAPLDLSCFRWSRLESALESGVASFFVSIADALTLALAGLPPSTRNSAAKAQQRDLVARFNIAGVQDAAAALYNVSSRLDLDVWMANHQHVDIRLSQAHLEQLLILLSESASPSHSILIEADELESLKSPQHSGSGNPFVSSRNRPDSLQDGSNVFFEDYRPLPVILPWFELLQSLYPTHVRRISVGKTFEGRDIAALKVGVLPPNPRRPLGPRKTIVISAGSHAREWISTSTVNYIAHHVVTMYGKSRKVTKLVEEYDWIFIPTMNPDGYVYTWEHDRLWRKNRQSTYLPFCTGIDLDRSYSFMWGEQHSIVGPCSNSYAGEYPFQAEEALSFSQWVRNETESGTEFVGFIDFHSYSQQILYPYAFSCQDPPPTLEDLEEMAEGLAKVMRRRGTFYDVLPACRGNVATAQLQEDRGGSPLDWFYGEMHVRHSYEIKLPDTGSYGFLLPKEYIVPTGEETLRAVLYLGGVLQNGPPGLTNTTRLRADVRKPLTASPRHGGREDL